MQAQGLIRRMLMEDVFDYSKYHPVYGCFICGQMFSPRLPAGTPPPRKYPCPEGTHNAELLDSVQRRQEFADFQAAFEEGV